VDADWADGKTLYIKAVLWGAIDDWNREHGPDEVVRAGDRIMAVNGCTGDAHAMVRECRDRSLLQLLVRRTGDKAEEEEATRDQKESDVSKQKGGPDRPLSGFLPGVQLSGQFVPGVTPPRVVDVLLDLRQNPAPQPADPGSAGGAAHAEVTRSIGGTALAAVGSANGPPPLRLRLDVGPPDHYKVLGLPNHAAGESEVKRCYRRLVLQWHPDKHPVNREQAEEKIRLINNAYETLGNPAKRAAYDQMLAAVERKKAGVRLETSFIKPRMSIPKEFMLCPLGYPDRFVRLDDEHGLRVQCREDVDGVSFKDFFQAAKFTLWWLPEVNNMCRVRARASAAQGVDGGLNFSFEFEGSQADAVEADITLSASQDMRRANLIAMASPFSQGAFRFEGAFWPGRYVSFQPPSSLRMAKLAEEGTDVVDFVLVDYSAAYKYMTTSEVLAGAVESHGGGFVKLSDLRADLSVRMYFQQMLGCAVWNNKDFETFFEGHYDTWDFDQKRARVRMRPRDGVQQQRELPMDWLELLQHAEHQADVAQALLCADEAGVGTLPVGVAIAALARLAEITPAGADAPPQPELTAARRRSLLVLQQLVRSRVGVAQADVLPLQTLLTAFNSVEAVAGCICREAEGGEDTEVTEARTDLTRRLASLVSLRIERAPEEVERNYLAEVLNMPLDWRVAAEPLRAIATRHAASATAATEPAGTFLGDLRAAVRQGREAKPVAEALAKWELQGLHLAEGQVAAEVLEVMVEGGVLIPEAVARLRTSLLHRLPLPELVRLVAVCAEEGLGADVLKPMLQARVAVAGPGLIAVPPASLLRLAMSAAKSPVIVEVALGPIAGAAAAALAVWPPDSVAELLLVVATKEAAATSPGARKLFAQATEILQPHLAELIPSVLLKVVVAAGTALTHCRALLEAAAEAATSRLLEFLPDQVLLLTQGMLGLGARHRAVVRLLDFWTEQLGGKGGLPSGALSADEVADLARLLALVAPGHIAVFEAIATRLIEALAPELTAAGRASLQAALPDDGGPDFPSRTLLLQAVFAGAGVRRSGTLSERSRSRTDSQQCSPRSQPSPGSPRSPPRSPRSPRSSRSCSQSPSKRLRRGVPENARALGADPSKLVASAAAFTSPVAGLDEFPAPTAPGSVLPAVAAHAAPAIAEQPARMGTTSLRSTLDPRKAAFTAVPDLAAAAVEAFAAKAPLACAVPSAAAMAMGVAGPGTQREAMEEDSSAAAAAKLWRFFNSSSVRPKRQVAP